MIRNTQVKILQSQTEETHSERELTEEETKAFLYQNYPDLYKQLYPDKVVDKKKPNNTPNPPQKRVDQDVQKSDKVYTYNKYGSAPSEDGGFSYKIEIKTDMNLNK